MAVIRFKVIPSRECKALLIFLIFFVTTQEYNQEVIAVNENSQPWDRLLIEEVPLLKENLEGIINALDKNNHTLVREHIDNIESGENWFNVRKELEARNQFEIISSFNNSISRLNNLSMTENSASVGQAQILLKDFNKIEQTLGQPIIDIQRLFLVILITGTLIAFGLHVIPKVRKRFNIRF